MGTGCYSDSRCSDSSYSDNRCSKSESTASQVVLVHYLGAARVNQNASVVLELF